MRETCLNGYAVRSYFISHYKSKILTSNCGSAYFVTEAFDFALAIERGAGYRH